VIDRTTRNVAAVTVAVGSLLVAPFLAGVAAKNESGALSPAPARTRVVIVPSPVVSVVTLPPGRDAKAQGHRNHGHNQGKQGKGNQGD
jgi:hypothetical protein